jgi:tRNA pseudouridine38-40 synthase
VRTLKLVVAYDGTDFHGWQVQPGQRTVQGVLEETWARVLGEAVRVRGAGRTDAGCHARGQVASLVTAAALPARALAPALNRTLPADLRVRSAEEMDDGFDARRSATARRYAYRLLDAPDVLLGRHAWHPRRRLDPAALANATAPLEGVHDFSSFRAAGGSASDPVCRVARATWRRWEGGLVFDVIADHFLYHMVRNLVGTALRAMDARDPAGATRGTLAARDRAAAGPTAPPQGLTLEQVFYAGGYA